jgi:hypothetical protein
MHPQTAWPRAAGILALLLVSACSGDDATVAPGTESEQADLTFTNGPASPGHVVFRAQNGDLIFLVPDIADNLSASIGLAETFDSWCDPTAPVTITPVDFQALEKGNGQLGVLFQSRSLPVIVYGVGTVEFCPDLIGAPIVATGTAQFTFNDRDFEDPPSYGYRATGELTLTSGGTAHFTGVVKWVTTGAGQVRVHSQITLTER